MEEQKVNENKNKNRSVRIIILLLLLAAVIGVLYLFVIEKKETKPEASGPAPLANGVMIRITHVTDGDTLYAVTQVGAWSHKIRLSGFNAPEWLKEKKRIPSDWWETLRKYSRNYWK